MSDYGDGMGTRIWPSSNGQHHHELVVEACKHLTTLDTAALIVVAIFGELSISFAGAAASLLAFGISLVCCVWGMLITATGASGAALDSCYCFTLRLLCSLRGLCGPWETSCTALNAPARSFPRVTGPAIMR